MKVSVDWLRDHVDFDLKIDDLSHLLTMCGLNCEGIEEHGDDHGTRRAALLWDEDEQPRQRDAARRRRARGERGRLF